MANRKKASRKNKTLLEKEKYTAELSSRQLVIGVCTQGRRSRRPWIQPAPPGEPPGGCDIALGKMVQGEVRDLIRKHGLEDQDVDHRHGDVDGRKRDRLLHETAERQGQLVLVHHRHRHEG